MRIPHKNKTQASKSQPSVFNLTGFSHHLNRRAFLKTGSSITLLAALQACKPSIPESEKVVSKNSKAQTIFSTQQKETLDSVQLHLFPDDGNGPSARDIKALSYLEQAMLDPKNIGDGDPEFILKGIGWLDDLAEQTQGDKFVLLKNNQQHLLLKKIAQSKSGKNWLSLLLYYLTEALMLDPIYGGNSNEIGWQWLEHQAGYPRPEPGKTYRDFD